MYSTFVLDFLVMGLCETLETRSDVSVCDFSCVMGKTTVGSCVRPSHSGIGGVFWPYAF